ncbi:LuxR C-terminal-related transcriptional regulator [Pararhizobium sp. PWRC1-1]|uniref:response regulator transcription factor n=1 Tax=Pararhizobium sp. PWRC1-1 TaxID=2804566 RepID=UPI003CF07CA4
MTHTAPRVQDVSADGVASLEAIPYLRTLLFVGPPDIISGAMTAAIEREFPCLSVKHAANLRSALGEFEVPLRLLLVDMHLAYELSSCAGEVLKRHPSTTFVIVTDGDLRGTVGWLPTIDTRLVRGILPLNVSLDVLLSMLRIILRGGTYFPSTANHDQYSVSWEGNSTRPFEGVRLHVEREIQVKKMDQLTKRENEILARMALGNPNKIIAAALALSEHTVKIHIHNIITKLSVHNRTEAVALYFEQKEKDVREVSSDGHLHSSGDPLPGGDA